MCDEARKSEQSQHFSVTCTDLCVCVCVRPRVCVRACVQLVRSQTLLLKEDDASATVTGALKENIKKNRYKDILPCRNTLPPVSSFSSFLPSFLPPSVSIHPLFLPS